MEEVTQGFSVSTIAAAKAIVEDTIDAAYEISAGYYVPSTFKADIMLYAVASRLAGGTKKYSMQTTLHAYHATAVNTMMKDNLTPVFTEWEDTITDSGLYNTVSNVSGCVTIRPDDFVYLTIASGIEDGHVYMSEEATWRLAKDAETGEGQNSSNTSMAVRVEHYEVSGPTIQYSLYRAFLYFNLFYVSGSISAVTLRVTGVDYVGAKIAVLKGTQALGSLTTADYDAQDWNALYGTIDSLVEGSNDCVLNAAGIAYVQSIIDAELDEADCEALFCLVEYNYDYLDVDPAVDVVETGHFYSGDHTTDAEKPTLLLSR